MSGQTKTHPYTTALQYSANGSAYTTLADLEDVDPPALERASAKATHLGSPSKTKEKLPGWRDSGKLTAKVYFSQAQYATLLAQFYDEVVYYYRILYPLIGAQVTNARHDFNGFITKLDTTKAEAENDDLFMDEIEFEITGVVTWTNGA